VTPPISQAPPNSPTGSPWSKSATRLSTSAVPITSTDSPNSCSSSTPAASMAPTRRWRSSPGGREARRTTRLLQAPSVRRGSRPVQGEPRGRVPKHRTVRAPLPIRAPTADKRMPRPSLGLERTAAWPETNSRQFIDRNGPPNSSHLARIGDASATSTAKSRNALARCQAAVTQNQSVFQPAHPAAERDRTDRQHCLRIRSSRSERT